LLVALAALTWGTIGITVRLLYGLTDTDPLSVGFWRLALSAPPLLLLSRWFAGPEFWRVQRRDLSALGLMGAASAVYQVCYFAAIPRIGLAAAVLINICSAPVIVAVLSALFLRERPTPIVGIVLVIALSGTALLVGGSPQAKNTTALLTGGALALGAGFFYSLVVLTARAVAARYHPVQPIALAFTLSALLLLPVVLATGLDVHYPPAGWLLVIYLGIVPTALGYGLYLRAMRTTPATVAAIVALLEPLISSVFAITLFGERLSPGGVVGGVMLLGSVVFLYWWQARGVER
jgi:DME family drug/metabolite transporter